MPIIRLRQITCYETSIIHVSFQLRAVGNNTDTRTSSADVILILQTANKKIFRPKVDSAQFIFVPKS